MTCSCLALLLAHVTAVPSRGRHRPVAMMLGVMVTLTSMLARGHTFGPYGYNFF